MLPGARAEWSFMERISGLERGFIFSLFFYTHTHSRTHTQSVSTCVSWQPQLSRSFGFTPFDPLLSCHCVLPFNFSPPRGGYKPFWKLLSISNFSAWLLKKKNQLIRKSSLGLPDRLRQGLVNLHLDKVFHTCVGWLSLQGVSAQFTVGKLIY